MKKRWRKFWKSHSPCLKIYSQMQAGEWNFTPLMALVDLEKAFDQVPWKVIWWALKKLGVEVWIMWLVQGRSRVKSLKWRSVITKARYSAGVHQGSVLSLLLFIIVLEALSRLGSPGKTSMPMTLMQERWRSWSVVRPGPLAEFRRVSMCHLSHWNGQQQHLLQWLQVLGAQEMQWAQALDKGPWLQMYMVPGNCTPFGRQTTEGSQSHTWQAGGGSLLLLPRTHTLSSWWLWTFNHNTCENCLEEVQRAATSSLFPPPLFQDMWLLCSEHNAPRQWDWAIDKAKPPTSAAKWEGNDQTDLQCQATRHCHHQIQWATCTAWHWGSGPHSEGENTPLVWTCGMLQWCRRQP